VVVGEKKGVKKKFREKKKWRRKKKEKGGAQKFELKQRGGEGNSHRELNHPAWGKTGGGEKRINQVNTRVAQFCRGGRGRWGGRFIKGLGKKDATSPTEDWEIKSNERKRMGWEPKCCHFQKWKKKDWKWG